jgi:hypothetical protein
VADRAPAPVSAAVAATPTRPVAVSAPLPNRPRLTVRAGLVRNDSAPEPEPATTDAPVPRLTVVRVPEAENAASAVTDEPTRTGNPPISSVVRTVAGTSTPSRTTQNVGRTALRPSEVSAPVPDMATREVRTPPRVPEPDSAAVTLMPFMPTAASVPVPVLATVRLSVGRGATVRAAMPDSWATPDSASVVGSLTARSSQETNPVVVPAALKAIPVRPAAVIGLASVTSTSQAPGSATLAAHSLACTRAPTARNRNR